MQPGWFVHFNEITQNPHRAYGAGISQSPEAFVQELQNNFGLQGNLEFVGSFQQGERTSYRWKQFIENVEVLFSDVNCVVYNDKIVSWNWDVFHSDRMGIFSLLSDEMLRQSAISNIDNSIDEVDEIDGVKYFPYLKNFFKGQKNNIFYDFLCRFDPCHYYLMHRFDYMKTKQ
jgi:hypothetical protein